MQEIASNRAALKLSVECTEAFAVVMVSRSEHTLEPTASPVRHERKLVVTQHLPASLSLSVQPWADVPSDIIQRCLDHSPVASRWQVMLLSTRWGMIALQHLKQQASEMLFPTSSSQVVSKLQQLQQQGCTESFPFMQFVFALEAPMEVHQLSNFLKTLCTQVCPRHAFVCPICVCTSC